MKFRKVPTSETQFNLQFLCPGCNLEHAINDQWQFNDNFESPTVYPSVLIQGGRPGKEGEPETVMFVCHSFITDGMIEFCGDSTHSLANKKVPLLQYKP